MQPNMQPGGQQAPPNQMVGQPQISPAQLGFPGNGLDPLMMQGIPGMQMAPGMPQYPMAGMAMPQGNMPPM
jgi:hypothetical protein